MRKGFMIHSRSGLFGHGPRYFPSQRLRLRKEGEQGGATGGGDNGGGQGGGNTGDSGTGGSGADNTGGEFDPSTFWTGPAPTAGAASGSGESAGSGSGESGTGGGGQDLNTQLTTQLASMKFGDPIFDQTIAEQINEGNFDGANKRFEASMQNAVRQAMAMNVQIMRPLAEQIINQVREEFSGTLEGRDNNQALESLFPAAKDPKVRPVVDQIFKQALKNTGNKRELAVKQTKEMLALMSNVVSGDLGLSVAPRGSDDSGTPTAVNWLDELTVR